MCACRSAVASPVATPVTRAASLSVPCHRWCRLCELLQSKKSEVAQETANNLHALVAGGGKKKAAAAVSKVRGRRHTTPALITATFEATLGPNQWQVSSR